MKKLILTLALIAGFTAQASPTKNVLVVLSSEDKITLRGGATHTTGFFLSELMVPVKALIEAGYIPVFATPKGNAPAMDKVSDQAFWFANETEYREIRELYEAQEGLRRPITLREALQRGVGSFAAILVPGGHAPMEDLLKDRELGRLLRDFHAAKKPTALICHGPIALLATLPDPEAYLAAVSGYSELQARALALRGQPVQNKALLTSLETQSAALMRRMNALTANWIYRDYLLTAFSTKEEQQEEPTGSDNVLGGYVKFYPDEALGFAGGRVVTRATKWQSNVMQDRELITGQNPMSDKEFAKRLVNALNAHK